MTSLKAIICLLVAMTCYYLKPVRRSLDLESLDSNDPLYFGRFLQEEGDNTE